jgi:hypothetical protein
MMRLYSKRSSSFHPHPRRLGPDRRATRGSWSLIRPPLTIVAIGSIPAILILASDFLSASLVAASACFHRASGQARGIG